MILVDKEYNIYTKFYFSGIILEGIGGGVFKFLLNMDYSHEEVHDIIYKFESAPVENSASVIRHGCLRFFLQCSKVCGGGIKTRTVECRQITAQDRIVSHPDHMCEGRKPQAATPCNSRPCGRKKPGMHIIASDDNQNYTQTHVNEVVSLKIGGKATVYAGSTMRIKCPVKNFNK